MHPKNIFIKDFTYTLPEDRIAKYPLDERDASKLLIYRDGNIDEDQYKNIAAHIPPGSLLIFNNTRVVEARLHFQKPTGGMIEIFCLEPHEQYPEIPVALQQQGSVLWKCLVGGASKWKKGQVLAKNMNSAGGDIVLEGRYKEKRSDHFIIELSWSPAKLSFAEVLHLAGAIPLPPYIKREADLNDARRYQTIYAHQEGSVAAPTAGLHFTDTIFASLQKKNIRSAFVTLHVGAGTFKPVKSEIIGDHEMHAEWMDISTATIETILGQINAGKDIVAIGTTSLRVLESLYWLGLKNIHSPGFADMQLLQWEPYELQHPAVSTQQALQSLLERLGKNNRERLITKTRIILAPGYKTRVATGLITNFHQPNSTLLLLVAALTGTDWKKIYDYALQNDFRFLSYGDGNLIWVSSENKA